MIQRACLIVSRQTIRKGHRITKGLNQTIQPFCDSVGIRTLDPQIRNLLLYPAELRNHAPFLSRRIGNGLQIYEFSIENKSLPKNLSQSKKYIRPESGEVADATTA